MKLKVVDVSTKYLCTCVLLEYTPVTKLTVDFFFKESWRRVKNYFADFVRKRTPPKSVILFLPWDKKQVFRGKKYHFQLFWRNLIGTLFKLIDPFPVKPHWHLHEIIYGLWHRRSDISFDPLLYLFVKIIRSQNGKIYPLQHGCWTFCPEYAVIFGDSLNQLLGFNFYLFLCIFG